jgi:hypothetical protein
MPYIGQFRRDIFDPNIEYILQSLSTIGELNYVITKLLLGYFPENSYQEYNAKVGLLECVKQELYRRVITPFEEEKRKLNGDVYGGVI